jgi:DNA-binding response OmpR family regulator
MSNSNKKRLLVIDDEADVSFALKMILEERGLFETDTYNNPGDVLHNFKAGVYDLILLDVRMPELNGFEMYRKIRMVDNKVKVCFLTAVNDITYYQAQYPYVVGRVNLDYFIINKPIDAEALIIKVNKILYKPTVCRVLVVDDEQYIANLLKKELEYTYSGRSFEVDIYTDPVLALENFREGKYEIILLDINMEKMNGVILYKKIKDIDKNAEVFLFSATEQV